MTELYKGVVLGPRMSPNSRVLGPKLLTPYILFYLLGINHQTHYALLLPFSLPPLSLTKELNWTHSVSRSLSLLATDPL